MYYTHYRYLKDCKCQHNGADVFRNDAQEYVHKCYIDRLQRMQKLNEKPSFLILDNKDGYTFTLDEIIQLTQINTNYKVIFVSDKDLSNISFPKNMKLIKDNGWDHIKICTSYHDEIFKFFEIKDEI